MTVGELSATGDSLNCCPSQHVLCGDAVLLLLFVPFCAAQATNISANILWTAGSLVLTRCFAVYTRAQTQRTMLQQQMTSSLYDKMQDSQEGVISVITEVCFHANHRPEGGGVNLFARTS